MNYIKEHITMIQEQINRQLSLLTGLYTQTGAYKEKQEYKQLEKKDAAVARAWEAPTTEEDAEQVTKDYAKIGKDIAKRKYELRPTRENFRYYVDAAGIAEEAEEANQRAREKLEMKAKQKGNTKKYIEEITKEDKE